MKILEKLKESWFYKNFIDNFSIISSVYQYVFTAIISVSFLLYTNGVLFLESTPKLDIIIFFMLLVLLVHRLDIIISEFNGIGSIAVLLYFAGWVISLLNGTFVVDMIILYLSIKILVFGYCIKMIIWIMDTFGKKDKEEEEYEAKR